MKWQVVDVLHTPSNSIAHAYECKCPNRLGRRVVCAFPVPAREYPEADISFASCIGEDS